MRRLATLPMLLVVLLAGCADAPESVASKTYRGAPAGTSADSIDEFTTSITWIEEGRTFAVTTWGSSSCPPVPTEIDGTGRTVVVRFEESPHDVCTADMAPTTHEFDVPTGTDPAGLRVRVQGAGEDLVSTPVEP